MTIYSYSKLRCYEQCPQKYKLKYIDKIKIDMKENVELFLGGRVHETLKKLYQDVRHQKKTMPEELIDFLRTDWHKKWNDSIVIVRKKYGWEDYLRKAERYITDYCLRYKPFNRSRTIALEKRIFIDLDDSGDYKLCGYIDRVAKTKDGWYEIHDYKTSSHFPTAEDIQNDWQLALYAMIVKLRYPYIRHIKLIWHFLKFDKEIQSSWTDEELDQLKQDMIRLINIIESTEEFSANPSRLCNWCEFKTICR
jgi:RecB family exonuclease